MPDFSLEDEARREGHRTICGIDEAGRGPWAGPVVAAAVVLNREAASPELLDSLDDSKKLSAEKRRRLYELIIEQAAVGVGTANVDEIDLFNILGATLRAMVRAVADISTAPDFALIDGNREPPLAIPLQTVVGGDGRSLSIAAASIVAKVRRDAMMAELADLHLGYGWERNAGYGTTEHRQALDRLGVTPQHRRSFAPIRDRLRRG